MLTHPTRATIGLNYDVQGNLAKRNGVVHSFDYGNRLRSVNGVERYRYDAHGRRVAAIDGQGTRVDSLYGSTGTLLYENRRDGGGATHYIHLGKRLLAMRKGNTTTWQHVDALGTPVATSNASGALVERKQYTPYGGSIGAATDGVGYTGHVMDAATGLTYMQQRYMDPELGMFLSVDPVTAYQQPVGAFNRYWYADNNPYKFTDPDGRQSCQSGSMKCHPSIASSVRTIGPAGNVSSSGGKSSTSISSAGAEPSTQTISSNGAFSHYKEGGGKPLRMNFNDIDTSAIKAITFPQVNSLISSETNGSFGIDSKTPFKTSGDQALFLGNITLRLQGTLSLNAKNYEFIGTLKSFDDTYDFNKSTHRGWLGEALTRWGAGQPGVPYTIQIRGSKLINETGDR